MRQPDSLGRSILIASDVLDTHPKEHRFMFHEMFANRFSYAKGQSKFSIAPDYI